MAYQEHYTQQLLDNLRAKLLIMGSKTQQALDDAAIAVLNHVMCIRDRSRALMPLPEPPPESAICTLGLAAM